MWWLQVVTFIPLVLPWPHDHGLRWPDQLANIGHTIALRHIPVRQTDDPGRYAVSHVQHVQYLLLLRSASSDAPLNPESELHPELYPELHWRWP